MTTSKRFEEINKHLLQDPKPSIYCNRIYGEPYFQKPPFDLMHRLRQTEQSPQHHPEGNVWTHTMLVVDEAARRKAQSKAPHVLLWAALLHDIGKPPCTRNKNGKITSYGHDKTGAALARTFLSELVDDKPFIQAVVQLVRWHMQILFVVNNLPIAEIDAMKEQTDIHEVALLGLCDRLGRKNADRDKVEETCRRFLELCSHYHKEEHVYGI